MTSNILLSFYESSGVNKEGEVAALDLTAFRGNHNAKLKKVSTAHFYVIRSTILFMPPFI